MQNICFVCTGNTCRSPMAEFIFKNMVKELHKAEIEVIALSNRDVIATSEVSGDDMDNDGWTSV